MKYIQLLLCLLPGHLLLAQDWTGAVNSDWNNPANWSATPGNGDNITIDPANYTGAMAQPVVSGTSSFTPAEMLVQNGAQLTISGNLNASDRVEILGAGTVVTITSGTFALNGGGNNARLIFAEDGHLQMNGGNLNIGQRLLFELGGTGEINSGSITVGETIALVDGSATNSSRFVQNGGTITTNGEFGFENEAGNFFPVFEQTGGTLNINGDLIWLGAAPGSGKGYFRSTGGITTVTGLVGNDPTSTMNMQIELSGSVTVFENEGTAVTLLAGDSIIVTDTAQWNDAGNVSWNNAGVLHSTTGAVFTAGTSSILSGAGLYQFANVAVPLAHAWLQQVPVISVNGQLVILGTYLQGNNKLVLNGNRQQTVLCVAATLPLYDLEINNSSNGPADGGYGVTLSSGVTIQHNLHFTDGIIQSSGVDVNVIDNATITGASDTTFVAGYINKAGDDAFTFPLGTVPNRYRPLSITAPISATTVVRAGYHFEANSVLTPVEFPLQTISSLEYWDLSRTGSSDLFTVTAGWNDASASGLVNCDDIALTVWNGSQWEFIATTATGLCDGENAGALTSTINLPVVGPLTFGFTENVYQNVVELCYGESITVGTNTYDVSGVYTDVLEDVNGEDSVVVTILTVLDPTTVSVTDNITHLVAFSPTATHYQWIDCANGNAIIPGAESAEFYPAANGSYAVIATNENCPADADTSSCVAIDQLSVYEQGIAGLIVYPNPVAAGEILHVTAFETPGEPEIRSLDGRAVMPEAVTRTSNQLAIQLPVLAPGAYLLILRSDTHTTTVKRFLVK